MKEEREREVQYPSVPIDDIDNTRWEASLLNQIAHNQHRERRLLSEFKDNCVATAKRRAQLPTSHTQGIVPRDDLAADTNGLLQCVSKFGRADVNDLAKVLVGVASVVLEGTDDLLDIFVPRNAVWLAVVNSLNSSQDLAISIDEIGELGHKETALSARETFP